MIFVVQKDLEDRLSACDYAVTLQSTYLLVEIFKIHEKEPENDKHGHEVGHTSSKRSNKS